MLIADDRFVAAIGGSNVFPTDAEMSLLVVAGYESELRIHSVQARRQFHTVSILIAIAGFVFGYDVLSVVIH